MTGPRDEDAAQQPTAPLEPLPAAPVDDVMGTPPAPPPSPAPPSGSGRPPWLGWAVGAAVVVAAIGGFFGAKALAGHSNTSNAININTNGSVPSGANPGAENGGGNTSGPNGGGNFRPGAVGTIASIDGSTLTIDNTRTSATQKVTTSSSTRVNVDKTASLSDIAKGDRIVVTGTTSGTTVTATSINDSGTGGAFGFRRNGGQNGSQNGDQGGAPGGNTGQNGGGFFQGGNGPGGNGGNGTNGGNGGRQFGNGNFAGGTVQSVNGNNIVITARDGSTMTVVTTTSTKITKSENGSVSDLKTGDTVVVIGTQASDGSIAATAINEGGGFRGRFGGGGGAGGAAAGGGPLA